MGIEEKPLRGAALRITNILAMVLNLVTEYWFFSY